MADTVPTPDAKVYNSMIGHTTLRGLWLTESRFDIKPQALEVTLRHETRSQVDEVIVHDDGLVYGFIRFEAASRHKRQRVIHVTAKYFVSYHVAGGCKQDTADLFIDRVGRLAAYPYFRALVASLVAQAGVAIPPLPIVSFQPRHVDYARDRKPVDAAPVDGSPVDGAQTDG